MEEPFVVRKLEAGDIDAFRVLWQGQLDYHQDVAKAYHEVPSRERVREEWQPMLGRLLADPETHWEVAVAGERLLGFSCFGVRAERWIDAVYVKVGWIHDLYVIEGARGTGVGSTLLRSAEQCLQMLGAEYMKIYCAPTNMGALRVYERAGLETGMHVLWKKC